MKNKLVAAAFLTAVTFTAQAQEGSWYVGGQVGFSSVTHSTDFKGSEVDGSKENSWSFSPEVGTFLTNNLQLGIGLTMAGSKLDARTKTENIQKTNYFGGTAYTRYFFGAGNFRPFVGVNVSILPGKETRTLGTATSDTKLMTIGANLNAGFAYGLSKRVTVVGSLGTLGFQAETSEVDGSDVKEKTNSFGLDANSLGNRFTIGVYYTFKR